MSSAWEVLEKQSKAKTDDVAAWEAKFSRLTVEVSGGVGYPVFSTDHGCLCSLAQKAKADQKYFATMREREALEAERKQMNRNMQQQALHVDNLTKAREQATEKIVSAHVWPVSSSSFDLHYLPCPRNFCRECSGIASRQSSKRNIAQTSCSRR